MANLGSIVGKVRSKNAGPFWLTVDIFCETPDAYEQVVSALSTKTIADIFRIDEHVVKRFDLSDLNVVKFSLPRPEIQGSAADRDMHGASWAALIGEIDIGAAA
ncbi:hypothetical protein BFP76_14005 [Amylibacter kogurei]|uniref:DUF4387 domain-containing protein n=1 Tax=Paramylibacter kogurei TaxID=1889778 RepID=A0A2G5KB18_9RHOB|nr:DUF4387 family protein [Amylibacter kogurei]PIB26070.1 hypothetical protein BFP76_14005 [Amylibacter kogurei]